MRRCVGSACAVCGIVFVVLAPGAQAADVLFSYSGGEQTWSVPAGVMSVRVVAVGGKGGTSDSEVGPGAPGGLGGVASADLAVAPGETLFIDVGGNGVDGTVMAAGAGGFNGGGAGTGGTSKGGGGGGGSDVRSVSRSVMGSLVSRVLVAGGGGGGGGSDFPSTTGGAGGGTAGTAGGFGSCGGGGGTATQEGPGGNGGPGNPDGSPGQLGVGGAGATNASFGSGGGGGGLFGGGGGGFDCAGGGGSGGFGGPTSATSFGADHAGVPSVTITYVVTPSVSISSPAANASYPRSSLVVAAYSCTAGTGTVISSCTGSVPSGSTIDTSTPGQHTFAVTAADQDGGSSTRTVTYNVAGVVAPTVSITSPANNASYAPSAIAYAAYSCTAGAGTMITSCTGSVPSGSTIDTSSPGRHNFTVTAVDQDGGRNQRTVTYTVRPKVTIATARIDRKHHRAQFTFTAFNASGFQCLLNKLYSGHKKRAIPHFARCTSPKNYQHLRSGTYTFEVRALSPSAGAIAKRRFSI